MNKLQLTQWFNGWQHPTRIGVYQRRYTNLVVEYCYWDGKIWYADQFPDAKWESAFQCLSWRGIAR